MEIIPELSDILIAFAGVTGLVLTVMVLAFQLGNVMSNLFED